MIFICYRTWKYCLKRSVMPALKVVLKASGFVHGERIEAREVAKTTMKAVREKKHKCAVRS